jgi:Tat protein secretion system quality control protein TatD with DNase activity
MECALMVYYDHRHEAKSYTERYRERYVCIFSLPSRAASLPVYFCSTRATNDNVSLESMAHPRNVGWGEIGLDYHYDNSPRDVQREVFTRQLRHAVRLGKPITVHTREADEDTESILKAEVPKDHKVQQWFLSVVSYGLDLIDLALTWVVDNPKDTHSLFHRLSRIRTALIGSFP